MENNGHEEDDFKQKQDLVVLEARLRVKGIKIPDGCEVIGLRETVEAGDLILLSEGRVGSVGGHLFLGSKSELFVWDTEREKKEDSENVVLYEGKYILLNDGGRYRAKSIRKLLGG